MARKTIPIRQDLNEAGDTEALPPDVEEKPANDGINKTRLDEVLPDALAKGHSIHEREGTAAAGLRAIARMLDELPKYLPDRAVADVGLEELNVRAQIKRLLLSCDEEFGDLRGHGIAVVWFTRVRKKWGQVLLADGGALPIKDRDCWVGRPTIEAENDEEPPWFRLELSLGYWLIADNNGRLRALHAALCRCGVKINDAGLEKPQTSQPEVVAFASTVGRFGIGSLAEATLHAHAMEHPETVERLKRYGFDGDGQLLLFPALV